MTILFITGLSGVGKSSVLREMNKRGYLTVDLDNDYIRMHENERLFNEDKIRRLLDKYQNTHLILAGTESNQGDFYQDFDQVIVLKTDLETMLARIESRTSNPYGKTEKERQEIIRNYKHVLPLLEKGADVVIDTTDKDVAAVSDQIETLLSIDKQL